VIKTVSDPQPVFDALDNYIAGTDWIVSTASVTLDGSGATHTITCSDRNGKNSYTYTERTAGVHVAVQPMSANLGPGETQQFTANATNPDGTPVTGATFTWALTTGSLGTLDANGLYTAPATIAANAFDTVTATLTGQQSWASITVQLHP